jgi:hypothetical protein
MRLPASVPKRWITPLAVSVVLVAALVASPAIGGPSVFGKKKVVKTIKKKVNVSQVVSPAPKPIADGGGTLLTLELPPGSYLVRSTFSVDHAGGGVVTCRLQIGGVAEDTATLFADSAGNTFHEESVSMETAGRVETATPAQLVCASGLPGSSIRYAEITAEKVPKLTVIAG